MPRDEVSRGVDLMRDIEAIAHASIRQLYERGPESRRFIESSYDACLEDMRHHVRALAVAMDVGDAMLLEDYCVWAKTLLAHRGLPDSCLVGALLALRETIGDRGGADSTRAAEMLDAALLRISEADVSLPSAIDLSDPLAALATQYLELLLAGDRAEAMRVLTDAVVDGVPVRDIYDRVLRMVQHEVGRLWQSGRLSVAMEHYVTGVSQVLMARLYPVVAEGGGRGPRFVGACVGGEQHELGIRMVCDLLELEGWDAVFLGADTPVDAVVAALFEHSPAVLGLSATLGFNVSEVARFIAAVREHSPEVLVVVGGRPFDRIPGLWKTVGADGYAASASEAAKTIGSLVADGPVA
ncbi:MAG: cobalamin-dependent protein [Coriobacteriia bacterium]|nr:cobalamin-dependent protein [Coriobacteriia bacterium]